MCKECNNGLAHLDVALADSFDFARFFVNQPSKKGQGPSVTGRSNLLATVRDGEPVIQVNLGPGDVKLPDGRFLKAPTNSTHSVKAQMKQIGAQVEVHFEAQAFQNPKFSRAAHKVAIGVIAATLGREAALSHSLNPAREFVLSGAGPKRSVLCRIPPGWRYFNTVWPPYTSEDGYCVVVTLSGIELVVDCTPNQTSITKLLKLIPIGNPKAEWVVVK